jgi:feruloyl esterase
MIFKTTLLLGLLGGVGSLHALTDSFESRCQGLKHFTAPHTVLSSAEVHRADRFTDPTGVSFGHLPPFCRLTLRLEPSSDSKILVEIWLPELQNWNHRFVGTGHGGFAGNISYADLAHTVRLGFAVANTDLGTSPSTVLDGRPLAGHPEKQIDYGYRATHEMTKVAQQIVHQFYEEAPKHSYFAGCSTGGAQGLIEARRYPEDYDGILSGAPAWSRTRLIAKFVSDFKALHRTPRSLITDGEFQKIAKAVVAHCAVPSGGYVGDGFLMDPLKCHWDPRELLCQEGQRSSACLNSDQITALKALYAGPQSSRTQESLYPGVEFGSESDFPEIEFKNTHAREPVLDGLLYWAFGKDYDWHRFDLDHDVQRLDEILGPVINTGPLSELKTFEKRGGKVILYHGWSDALLSPRADIDFYKEGLVDDVARKSLRLFLLPGMGHCYGGPGPNVIGGFRGSELPTDADHDALLALDRWVDQGIAPRQLIATKYVNDDGNQAVEMARPVCAYPEVARYLGHGDRKRAESFSCP